MVAGVLLRQREVGPYQLRGDLPLPVTRSPQPPGLSARGSLQLLAGHHVPLLGGWLPLSPPSGLSRAVPTAPAGNRTRSCTWTAQPRRSSPTDPCSLRQRPRSVKPRSASGSESALRGCHHGLRGLVGLLCGSPCRATADGADPDPSRAVQRSLLARPADLLARPLRPRTESATLTDRGVEPRVIGRRPLSFGHPTSRRTCGTCVERPNPEARVAGGQPARDWAPVGPLSRAALGSPRCSIGVA